MTPFPKARLALLLASILLGNAHVPILAAETPPPVRWGGTSSPNMRSGARGLPADPSKATLLWELRLGSHQYTIPTIDRGIVFLGTDDLGFQRPGVKPTGGGVLWAVEQTSGKVLWRLASPRYMQGVVEPYHFDQWKCGFCSGPVVDGDRVWIVGNRGDILCLDREGQADGNDGPFLDELDYMQALPPGRELTPTDGDIVWRVDLIRNFEVVPHDVCGSTLLLVKGVIYACTSNGVDGPHTRVPSPGAPSLIALDAATGAILARDEERIGERMLHGQWSSPAAGEVEGRTQIYFGGGDGVLYAFEAVDPSNREGGPKALRKLWAHDVNPPDYRMRDGKTIPYSRWNQNSPEGPSEIIGTPVPVDGRVYATIGQSPVHGAGAGILVALDAATGRELWSSRLVERTLSTVAVEGGLLYANDYTGRLHCFDAARGDRLWVHELESPVWGASPFVADGRVYQGTEAGTLWVLAAGREKQILSRTDFESVPITPVAVDGILYLPTQKKLRALATAPPKTGDPRS